MLPSLSLAFLCISAGQHQHRNISCLSLMLPHSSFLPPLSFRAVTAKNPTKLNPSPSRESNSIPHPLCLPLCPKSAPASDWTWNIPLFSKKQTSWIFISVSKLSLHSTTVLRIRETMEKLGKAGDWCHLFSCAFMKEVPWRCSAISPLFGKWHLAVENKDKLSVNFN